MDTVRKWLLRFLERPYIRLQLTVVVLVDPRENSALDTVKTALESSKVFWLDLGIMLQPVVRGWQEVPDPHASLGDNLHELHRWSIGTPSPTIYVFNDATFLETGVLGLAWEHNGIAAVAGSSVPDINLDELIDHELGHLLGLDHEDNTFMRATLELHNRVVTTVQRIVMLRNAYGMGGF